MKLRAVIAEDEPLALRRLSAALRRTGEIEIVGEASDGATALELVEAARPNVLLLDIMMPGMTGVDLLRALDMDDPPAVIFVTAYDHFAVDAFEEGAVDYVLKPLDEERLAKALGRARERLLTIRNEQRVAQLRAALDALDRQMAEAEPSPYQQDIWITRRGVAERLPVKRIEWFEAAGDYVVVHANGSQSMMHDSIASLAERLDPKDFARVHRSSIVALAQVRAVERGNFGAVILVLESGARVAVSRTYRAELLERLQAG